VFFSDDSGTGLGAPAGQLANDGWHSWFGTYTGIVFITVAGLPLAVLTAWALARRRRLFGATSARAWRASLAEVGIVYGTLPWLLMTMMPGNMAGVVHSRLSLVPLQDLLTMPMYQVLGNLLIFAALGFLAPVRFAGLASLRRILALAAAGSVLIETAQYVLPLDRVSSVDDVLLNTAGAGLAALASHRWWRTRPAASSEPTPSGSGSEAVSHPH
jgi:VanZ like family